MKRIIHHNELYNYPIQPTLNLKNAIRRAKVLSMSLEKSCCSLDIFNLALIYEAAENSDLYLYEHNTFACIEPLKQLQHTYATFIPEPKNEFRALAIRG